MKKSLIVIITLLLLGSVASGQYRENKKIYDFRDYTHQAGDPYNPVLAAGLSLLIPGFGQVVSGELLRGTRFLAGVFISAGVSIIGFGVAWGQNSDFGIGGVMMLAGAAGVVTIWAWSIYDATKVARVNNMAYQANGGRSMNLQLSPYVGYAADNPGGYYAPGLTLRLNF